MSKEKASRCDPTSSSAENLYHSGAIQSHSSAPEPPRINEALLMQIQWIPDHILLDKVRLEVLRRDLNSGPTTLSNGFDFKLERDRGYTFRFHGFSDLVILNEVAKQSRTKRLLSNKETFVECISIGAGQGELERVMLVAGARLDVIEQGNEVSQQCVKRLGQALQYFRNPSSVKLADVARVFVTDAMGKHVGSLVNKYDIAVARYFLHMLHPHDLPPFFARIYNMLRPGGVAFLTGSSPSSDNSRGMLLNGLSAFDVLTMQRAAASPDSGFMIMLKTEREWRESSLSSSPRTIPGKHMYEFQPMHEKMRSCMPQTTIARNSLSLQDRNVRLCDFFEAREQVDDTLLAANPLGDVWESTHVITYSVFDLRMLRELATHAGLEVVTTFYANTSNDRVHVQHEEDDVEANRQMFRQTDLTSVLQVRKPDSEKTPIKSRSSSDRVTSLKSIVLPDVRTQPSWEGIGDIPSTLELTPEEQIRADAFRVRLKSSKLSTSHTCSPQCAVDRPMSLVLAAIKSVIPLHVQGARLNNELTILQHRFVLAGYGTPEYQALFQTMFDKLDEYEAAVFPKTGSLNRLVRELVSGVEDYIRFIPAQGEGGAMDATESIGDGKRAMSEWRAQLHDKWMQMSVDELSLRLHLVPLSIVLQRLKDTHSVRCRSRRESLPIQAKEATRCCVQCEVAFPALALLRCSRCFLSDDDATYYCSPNCQKLHWSLHRNFCTKEPSYPADEPRYCEHCGDQTRTACKKCRMPFCPHGICYTAAHKTRHRPFCREIPSSSEIMKMINAAASTAGISPPEKIPLVKLRSGNPLMFLPAAPPRGFQSKNVFDLRTDQRPAFRHFREDAGGEGSIVSDFCRYTIFAADYACIMRRISPTDLLAIGASAAKVRERQEKKQDQDHDATTSE